jgi:hypothetical protein
MLFRDESGDAVVAIPQPGHAWLAGVASVNVVENRPGAEVAIAQAARGGSFRVSASGSGESTSAIASTCM